MFIKNDTRDDTHMRYDGSYVRIAGVWHYIEKIEKLTNNVIFFSGSKLVRDNWEIFPSTSFALDEIDISFPKLGTVLVQDLAFYIAKKHSSSRKLTLCNDRLSITVLSTYTRGTLTREILQDITSPKYNTVQGIQQRDTEKKDSVLSDSISVVHTGGSPSIFRGKSCIGKYINGKACIIDNFKLFKQELEEVGLTVEVV